MKTISISMSDGEISSLQSYGGCVTFRSDGGDEICLEENTLKRGLAVIEANRNIDEQNTGAT